MKLMTRALEIILLLLSLYHATFSSVLRARLQDSTPTLQSPITKNEVMEYFNDSFVLINSTYNATMIQLANLSDTTNENVSTILINPTSQIDAFIEENWAMSIKYLIYQAQDQGTFRNECLVYEPIAKNIPNVLKPQIIECTNDESNKTLAYCDDMNTSIPLELNDFPSGLYQEIQECSDTDVDCLKSALGEVKKYRGLVINELNSTKSDIIKKGQDSAEALDECQMLEVYKIKYDNVFSEMAACLDVK